MISQSLYQPGIVVCRYPGSADHRIPAGLVVENNTKNFNVLTEMWAVEAFLKKIHLVKQQGAS